MTSTWQVWHLFSKNDDALLALRPHPNDVERLQHITGISDRFVMVMHPQVWERDDRAAAARHLAAPPKLPQKLPFTRRYPGGSRCFT